MRTISFLSALFLASGTAFTAWGADLTKIIRTIDKEPAYKSPPQYCLLVFGPEAKTRVWLVRDGDVLYVDRNSNGDLTEPDERVPASKRLGTFEIGDIIVGTARYSEVWTYGAQVSVLLPNKIVQAAGRHWCDKQGELQWSDRPQTAPIIHFGGPLTMGLYEARPILSHGLRAVVGTPGLGKGTFAVLDGDWPRGMGPVADVTFPSTGPGGKGIAAQVKLIGRPGGPG